MTVNEPGTWWSREPIEEKVIRSLGIELAQARVDLGYAHARLEGLRDVIAAVQEAQTAALASPSLEGFQPPPGFTIVPGDLLLTLQTLLS